MTGAVTQHIDVAVLVLFTFWLFFAALLYYLRREDRREGYPLESEDGKLEHLGPVFFPEPKSFLKPNGSVVKAPDRGFIPERPINATPVAKWAGAPLEPDGDAMLDGVGPAAWANRPDHPDMTTHNTPKIVPMRVAEEFSVAQQDVDPRGLPVAGGDGMIAGMVSDIWFDSTEAMIRYLEVEVSAGDAGGKRILVPMTMCTLNRWKQRMDVDSVKAVDFAKAPTIQSDRHVTLLEEERITAFFAGGLMYSVGTTAG